MWSSGALSTALSSLMANQLALSVASNNIANAGDPNCTRRRLVPAPAGSDGERRRAEPTTASDARRRRESLAANALGLFEVTPQGGDVKAMQAYDYRAQLKLKRQDASIHFGARRIGFSEFSD